MTRGQADSQWRANQDEEIRIARVERARQEKEGELTAEMSFELDEEVWAALEERAAKLGMTADELAGCIWHAHVKALDEERRLLTETLALSKASRETLRAIRPQVAQTSGWRARRTGKKCDKALRALDTTIARLTSLLGPDEGTAA